MRRAIAALLVALATTACGGTSARTQHTGTGSATATTGQATAATPTARAGTRTRTSAGGVRVSGAGGPFAGYVWQRNSVTSLSSSWRVPMIRTSAADASPVGSAGATWIGAQAPGAGSPFIQIGVNEYLSPSGTHQYDVLFWSDSAHHDQPITLGVVKPGDALTASMAQLGGHWTLEITDRTRQLHRQVNTAQEGEADFNLAEWTQEDPTGPGHRALPYPQLSTVTMYSDKVDGLDLYDAESQWMALPHGYLGPSALDHDAFTIVPEAITATGARFLRLELPFLSAEAAFEHDVSLWTPATPAATVEAESRTFVTALASNVAGLHAQAWPMDVTAQIRRLGSSFAAQGAALRSAARRGVPRTVAMLFFRDETDQTVAALSVLIRHRLGLPETSS